MSGWTDVFLGVIAVATLATAVMQVVALLAASRLARRLERLSDTVENELKPIAGHVTTFARDASRVASMAVAQAERIDRMLTDIVTRLEETLDTVQASVRRAAEGSTPFLLGLRAVLAALRDVRSRSRRRRGRRDEDDALFI